MKKILLTLIAVMTLSVDFAGAYIVPGPPGPPGRPAPYPGNPGRPGRPAPYPGNPYPGEPYPGNPYPGNPGYGTISVPVYLDRRMSFNDQIDISQYVNLNQYRGYRLAAIDFTANSLYGSALIDILVNSFQISPTVNLNPYPNNFRIIPNQNMYIGYGADSIVIYSRGDLYIRNMYLQLSR